ncbi:hypothetical protein LWP59_36905 [Amycolatopsis acidiphila]|uniref:DUF5666 domain-containing protein n=1 Tax=Amycolatopsis acidiphila TaxID=715473 RepID=A0A558AEK2_9PSEU|nr:hypothetical protein [Amycolatopsis acidiphila]TVT22688.1 hypothetical protein FNH06_12705 [Amycolatopsis acidiphila]UIJ59546.1 hypothetical protein LWP59_36905 [Amycolatopsis acidiphila]GHG80543.1 hypothetical protein GCM10017788_49620 [Amycolatopsis acidiphila]
MTTEPTTTPQAPPAWGDPQPPAPKWSGRKTAIAAAVAIVIAAVGGVAIYAGTSGSTGQQGFGGPGGGRMGGFNGGQFGGTAALSQLRDALHGDFTVAQNGGYVTERMQTGDVSALGATSITVKSKDDYTQTYTVDSSTEKANNLATGSSVTVLAKVSGSTATATSITDGSQAQQGGQGGFPRGGGQGGFPGGSMQGGPRQQQGSSN